MLKNTARKPGATSIKSESPASSATPSHVALVSDDAKATTTSTRTIARRPIGPRDPNDELLTPEQVEAEFGISRANLATWRSRGGGPRFHLPRPRRPIYRRGAIIEWLGAEVRTTGEARARADRAAH